MPKFRYTTLLFALAVLFLGAAPRAKGQDSGHQDGQNGDRFHYKVLHNFQGKPDANGNFDPLLVQGLVADQRGTIFGEARDGGPLVCITIGGICSGIFFDTGAEFQLDRHGNFTSFPNPATTVGPANGSLGPMLLDSQDHPLFATTSGGANGVGGVFSLDPRTGTFMDLFSLSGSPVDGADSAVDVIRDPKGNLFGTTIIGDQNPDPNGVCKLLEPGCGTVYKLDAKTHQETVLHSFTFDDGFQPVGLALDKNGNLFGAASLGDDGSCRTGFEVLGCGNIFRIDPQGNFSFVFEFHHSFTCPFVVCPAPPPNPGPPPELLGWNPQFLTVDEDGNIFGVTGGGGNFGLGVIFKVDPSGQYSVLHHFAGPDDGFVTIQLLLREGKLYGINQEGGDTLDCDFGNNGCGTIFRLDTRTGEYNVLHTFSSNADGTTPTALAFDENGDLIGANLFGGNGVFDPTVCTGGGGCGNVFRLKLSEHGGDHGDDDE